MIQISVDCDPKLDSPNQEYIINILTLVFNNYNIIDGDLTLIFGTDELLSQLKKEYFKKDQLTDVIAFRLNDYEENSVEGEIYISLPRAAENAKSFCEQYEKEVARLIIHGSLHLLGHTDKTKKDRAKMTQIENQFLDQVNWRVLFDN
ncbi:MAG: rRNA maturation RNase YbeY [Candidatus Marinimicrobia bacterium]|nr:rRNA maturation RNase YbeY [Candidatus Neomarinimicrobiota bacterium]